MEVNWLQLWAKIQVIGAFGALALVLFGYSIWLISFVFRFIHHSNLCEAIRDAHNGRNVPLDIKHYGGSASWNQNEDKGYIKYRDARELIRRYKLIEKILCRLNYI